MEARNRQTYKQTSYISGNTARRLSAVEEPDYDVTRIPQRVSPQAPVERPRKRPEQKPSRRPAVGRGIDFLSMIFLTAAMGVTLFVCFHYLKVQSDSVLLDKQIVALEAKTNKLKDKNDIMEITLNQPMDLNEVYNIAVGELGMVHPNKNERIEYESEDVGYVRQYEDIPDLN